MGTQIEKTKFSMSIKFFFVFVLSIASALSKSVFKHEAIGDITSTHAEKTANGIAVKASAAGDKTPISVSRSGKCWTSTSKVASTPNPTPQDAPATVQNTNGYQSFPNANNFYCCRIICIVVN